jgi:hypothetical protein
MSEREALLQARRLGYATPRQARLIDWMKHPNGLPDHPAIEPESAAWTAREIVEHTGLYESRRAALADLNELTKRQVLYKQGSRYRYSGGWSL